MTSEARLIGNMAFIVVGNGVLIGSCLFAWLKGRPAERYGGLVYFASAVLDVLLALITRNALPIEQELFIDGLAAVGFLFLALRYNSLWLGAAMMLKGIQLALHAFHLTGDADPRIGPLNVYILALDVGAYLISGTLIAGTIASIRARRRRPADGRSQRADYARSAPPQAA